MALFFMHVANDTGITVDEDGREYERTEAAIAEASRTAGALLSEELERGIPKCRSRCIWRTGKESAWPPFLYRARSCCE